MKETEYYEFLSEEYLEKEEKLYKVRTNYYEVAQELSNSNRHFEEVEKQIFFLQDESFNEKNSFDYQVILDLRTRLIEIRELSFFAEKLSSLLTVFDSYNDSLQTISTLNYFIKKLNHRLGLAMKQLDLIDDRYSERLNNVAGILYDHYKNLSKISNKKIDIN